RGPNGQLDMHPLLRTFLLAKLCESDKAGTEELVDRALRSLGRARRWDDCLVILDKFPGAALTSSLLGDALDELLASGRLATIKRWLSVAPRGVSKDAVLLLADAEVAVREGRNAQAKTIAEQA